MTCSCTSVSPENPLCSSFNPNLIDIILLSPHSDPCSAAYFTRVLKKHNSFPKFMTLPTNSTTRNGKVPLFILLTFPHAFGDWGWGLSLSDHVIKHTYSKPLSPLSPPTIHFLIFAILGNELTSLPLHPHQVILSFFCTGRSGAFPGGAACTLSLYICWNQFKFT